MCNSITIPRRFNGPNDSGNGGYVGGLLGKRFAGPAAISLRLPPPLETPLDIIIDGDAQDLLLSGKLIERHHRHGQQLGSGFAASRYGLYRELNRGVDWVFTNDALRLESIRQQALRQR